MSWAGIMVISFALIFASGNFAQAQALRITPPSKTLLISPTPTSTQIPKSTIDVSIIIPKNRDDISKIIFTAILSVAGTLFVVFFKHISANTKRVIANLWGRVRTQRLLELRYRKRISTRLRSIQILWMSESKVLSAFYIPLKLSKWIEPKLINYNENNAIKSDFVSLPDALEKFNKITIVGSPGAGKTTITSHVAAATAEKSIKICNKSTFPIFVELRRLKEFLEDEKFNDKSLHSLLCEILERTGFENSSSFLDRQLQTGNCLVVLDGFDELADNEGLLQRRLANKVNDFIESISSENRVVITSRATGYEPAWFPGFKVLEMSELNLEQERKFIKGWFHDEDEYFSATLITILEKNDRLQLLVSNPLMLAIVCYIFSISDPLDHLLPNKRVDLYERCIEALVTEWDKSRKVDRVATFSPKEIITVLQHVAFESLLLDQINFSRKHLLALIRSNMEKAELPRYQDEDLLMQVIEHTGIFIQKARDLIGFLHLTFQEYLAARVIAKMVEKGIETKSLRSEIYIVLHNFNNPKWAEPIALTSGILRGRKEFVEILINEYDMSLSKDSLLLLANCFRDSDLEDIGSQSDILSHQDRILSGLVDLAFELEYTNARST